MKQRQSTVVLATGKKVTYYMLEHESGVSAKSLTKDYKRLKKVLGEELQKQQELD